MINKGDFLISTPESLGDYYFNRSIVILTEVSDEEVVGFIINKELNYTLSDLDNKVLEKNIKIFSGGPVNQDNLYFIHKYPHLIDNSINFFNDLHWGGDFKKIIEMNKNVLIKYFITLNFKDVGIDKTNQTSFQKSFSNPFYRFTCPRKSYLYSSHQQYQWST